MAAWVFLDGPTAEIPEPTVRLHVPPPGVLHLSAADAWELAERIAQAAVEAAGVDLRPALLVDLDQIPAAPAVPLRLVA